MKHLCYTLSEPCTIGHASAVKKHVRPPSQPAREVMQGARTALHRVASSQLQAFLDLNCGLDRAAGRRIIIVLVCICPHRHLFYEGPDSASGLCTVQGCTNCPSGPCARPHIPTRCLDLIHLVGTDADPTDPVGTLLSVRWSMKSAVEAVKPTQRCHVMLCNADV